MIKKWLNNIMPTKKSKQKIKGAYHHIPLDFNNHAALKVLEQLHRSGYEAYLVGGAVRDLLLGVQPKDFDIATNARPEQVSKIFRRSRIIGRRFQIVHVMVGSETIEVSTFRSGGRVKQNEFGRIMQDNAYGTLEQDAMRRDFTCNALYYDIHTHQIIDFHNGLDDVKARKIVMIGDPAERYHEDPVRMLRAVRLSGKLGFQIEEKTAAPIPDNAILLRKEPVARLFDEMMKILFSGKAESCLKQLTVLNNVDIHPMLTAMFQAASPDQPQMGRIALQQTDLRLQENKSVSVGFVLAAFFWQALAHRWQVKQKRQSSAAAMNDAISSLHEDMEHGWGVPQRYSATMREIWALQPQFESLRGNRPFRLLSQARFRAAYDFLLLRAQCDETLQPLADWWTKFQHTSEEERRTMTQNQPQPEKSSEYKPAKKKRRRPRKKKKAVEE
ncbi:polynucleotide adenylyltransferase PcnB [Kingella negevensis]|uniref:polynucleotide adenylyltransferase PcnB n=1 Tax=Kingella negevensis TaxID=1522312 RepID=UPI0025515678|nr:polynucleotide adenylyltransferase PcnB [Kingella negevensis]MDK4685100.1 polynucleotide adenylyltransferase PcnB [Kingella negevensis]MDK4696694.1 polynucleotide adenylyltransferase PcnB [Kingella negevensis]MDK4707874.1 polynucleotide adenylyltransferase PcnB [Kingella negevensis]MDK4709396.1 polynucleotide adenylyltransferase PcnB [Kingella negevensis]